MKWSPVFLFVLGLAARPRGICRVRFRPDRRTQFPDVSFRQDHCSRISTSIVTSLGSSLNEGKAVSSNVRVCLAGTSKLSLKQLKS